MSVPNPVAERSTVRFCCRSLAGIVGSNPVEGIDVRLCKCSVLSDRGLCDGPISRPEESYRLRCVIVCDLETSRMRRHWPALGCCALERKTKSCPCITYAQSVRR
jgi:hypothetical protein